jgi:hypothetical protein
MSAPKEVPMGTWWRGILVAVVLLGGVASAQSYVGVSAGLPIVLVSGHVGFEDLIAPAVDLRVNLGGAALFADGGGVFGATVGADALWRLVGEEPKSWTPYAGVGLGIFMVGAGGGGSVAVEFGGTGTVIGGVDYDFGELVLFGELRGEVLWIPAGGFLGFPGIRVGVKFPW